MTDKELAEEYEEKAEYIEINDDGKRQYELANKYVKGVKIGEILY